MHGQALLLFALVASLEAANAFGAAQTGRIAGSVEDATGGRIANAAVSLAGPVDRTVTTDADGRFAFGDLPDGEYRLRVGSDGFAPAEQRVQLSGGATVSVAFRLVVQVAERIVVTASKTGEHELQSTPLAVSVLSAEELRRSESQTVEDLAGQSPSLTFSQNTGFSQLTIRGIGTNAVFTGADPSSAVYVDGVYLARPTMVLADFVDLDRVEVLRGPQGTLYGRNAVGGALNILTKLPSDTFEASARIAAGNLGARRVEASVSGPIVAGRLRGSAALLRGVEDGFVRDLEHPGHPLGGVDVLAARAKLQYVWSPRVDLLLSGDVTHQDPTPLTYPKVLAVKPGFVVDNPQDLHEVRASILQESRNLQYGTAARLAVQLSPQVLLTSLTAFRKIDYDLLWSMPTAPSSSSSRRGTTRSSTSGRRSSRSRGRSPGRSWVAGVFLFGDQDRQPITIGLGGPRLVSSLDPEVRSRSGAVFAQATFGLTHGVSATAGLRYTRERKTIDNAGRLDTQDVTACARAGLVLRLLRRDRARRLDAEARARVARPRADARLRLRDAGLQERRLQPLVAGGGPRLRSRVGLELRSRAEDEPGRRPRRARSRGLSDELHGPAGPDGDPPRRAGHLERRRGHDLGSRAGSVRCDRAWAPFGRTPGLARRHVRPLRRRWRRRGDGRRRRQPAQQRSRVVGAPLARVEPERGPARDAFASRRLALAEHGLLHAVQRRRPAPEPATVCSS